MTLLISAASARHAPKQAVQQAPRATARLCVCCEGNGCRHRFQVVGGRDAKEVKDALMAEGIMVRHYAKKELSGYIRVSVGKPEHTDALQRALQRIC